MFCINVTLVLRQSGLALALLLIGTAAQASPFTSIRVGDADGFGFGTGSGLKNFVGDPVNVDGVGPLGMGDFLPDLNQDGLVMHFQGDDFDNRTSGEIGGSSLTGSGFADVGSSGSQFTDLSLSQSYADSGLTDFPDSDPTDRNDAQFVFDFTVNEADIVQGAPVFFNIVYGDVGLLPADLELTLRSGSQTITLSPINPSVEDGLIQAAFASLDFNDVFQKNGSIFEGLVTVDLVTRPTTVDGDPFYGIDFAELSQSRIGTVPEPGTLALVAAGIASFVLVRTWRRQERGHRTQSHSGSA